MRGDSRDIWVETSRLVLRPLEPGDLESFHRILNDPDVGRYLCDGEPVSAATVESYLRGSEREFAEGGVGLFGVRPRGESRLIGFCGFSRAGETGEMELMYGLLPEWWGGGFATEAARASLRHAFEEAGLERVFAGIDEPNAASRKVAGKLGMRRAGGELSSARRVLYFTLSRREFEESGEPGN